MTAIPEDRLRAAKENAKPWKYANPPENTFGGQRKIAADFAEVLLKLQPWAERARRALTKIKKRAEENNDFCPLCRAYPCLAQCELAELLREEAPAPPPEG